MSLLQRGILPQSLIRYQPAVLAFVYMFARSVLGMTPTFVVATRASQCSVGAALAAARELLENKEQGGYESRPYND